MSISRVVSQSDMATTPRHMAAESQFALASLPIQSSVAQTQAGRRLLHEYQQPFRAYVDGSLPCHVHAPDRWIVQTACRRPMNFGSTDDRPIPWLSPMEPLASACIVGSDSDPFYQQYSWPSSHSLLAAGRVPSAVSVSSIPCVAAVSPPGSFNGVGCSDLPSNLPLRSLAHHHQFRFGPAEVGNHPPVPHPGGYRVAASVPVSDMHSAVPLFSADYSPSSPAVDSYRIASTTSPLSVLAADPVLSSVELTNYPEVVNLAAPVSDKGSASISTGYLLVEVPSTSGSSLYPSPPPVRSLSTLLEHALRSPEHPTTPVSDRERPSFLQNEGPIFAPAITSLARSEARSAVDLIQKREDSRWPVHLPPAKLHRQSPRPSPLPAQVDIMRTKTTITASVPLRENSVPASSGNKGQKRSTQQRTQKRMIIERQVACVRCNKSVGNVMLWGCRESYEDVVFEVRYLCVDCVEEVGEIAMPVPEHLGGEEVEVLPVAITTSDALALCEGPSLKVARKRKSHQWGTDFKKNKKAGVDCRGANGFGSNAVSCEYPAHHECFSSPEVQLVKRATPVYLSVTSKNVCLLIDLG
jgi:hypothetical protein